MMMITMTTMGIHLFEQYPSLPDLQSVLRPPPDDDIDDGVIEARVMMMMILMQG